MHKIMKKFFILNILLAFLFCGAISFAQPQKVMVVKSFPKFTLQVNLNYNQSFLEFNGTYNNDFHSKDFMNGAALGADKGIGGSVTSKIALSDRGRMRLNLSLNYNNFKTYLFGQNHQLADIGKSSINIMSFGVGLEHNFTPNYKFKIYLGAEGTGNLISGKSTIWVDVPSTPGYTYDVTITNSFRIGAAIFAGTEYMLNDRMGLSFGFKYNFANLLLKSAKDSSDPNSFPLRDDNSNLPYSGKKTIAYISITGGVNFYWGVTSKRYLIK
jgi:opacity protein-like surface antigen